MIHECMKMPLPGSGSDVEWLERATACGGGVVEQIKAKRWPGKC